MYPTQYTLNLPVQEPNPADLDEIIPDPQHWLEIVETETPSSLLWSVFDWCWANQL